MPELIDLDAAKRARQEVQGEAVTFPFGGKTFTIPAELEWEVGELIDQGNYRQGFAQLLNGQADDFWALKPTFNDLKELHAALAKHYAGLLAGESPASRSPSSPTTKSSRRPSKRSTAST